MVPKITNLPLNANTAGRIVKRVMKDKNMEVVRNFTPVVSEHTVQINPNKRIRLTLTDNEFQYAEERKLRNNWKEMIAYKYTDAREKVEEKFFQFVSLLSNIK